MMEKEARHRQQILMGIGMTVLFVFSFVIDAFAFTYATPGQYPDPPFGPSDGNVGSLQGPAGADGNPFDVKGTFLEDVSFQKNVGIGTRAVEARLGIAGEVEQIVNRSFLLGKDLTTNAAFRMRRSDNVPTTYIIESGQANAMNSARALSINPSGGNVGIGTLNPQRALHVMENGLPTLVLQTKADAPLGTSSAGVKMINKEGQAWTLVANGIANDRSSNAFGIRSNDGRTNRFMIAQDGNVGIGIYPDSTNLLSVDGKVNAKELCIKGDCRDKWGGGESLSGSLKVAPASFPTSFTGKQDSAIAVTGGIQDGQVARLTFGNGAQGNYAGIGAKVDGNGSSLLFGTSSNYGAGITNQALVIDRVGNIGIGVNSPSRKLAMNVGDGDGIQMQATTHATFNANAYEDVIRPLSTNSSAGINKPNNSVFLQGLSAGSTYGAFQILGNASDGKPLLYWRTEQANSGTWNPWMQIVSYDQKGRVGIGTQNPNAPLHVELGSIMLGPKNPTVRTAVIHAERGGGDDPLIYNDSGGGVRLELSHEAPTYGGTYEDNKGGYIQTVSEGSYSAPIRMDFGVSGDHVSGIQTKMSIKANGRVGIGTTDPSSVLDVRGGDINIDGARTIYSRGSMHLQGEGVLDLMFPDPVRIRKGPRGGSGNLEVEGDLDVKGKLKGLSVYTREKGSQNVAWDGQSEADRTVNCDSGDLILSCSSTDEDSCSDNDYRINTSNGSCAADSNDCAYRLMITCLDVN